MCRRLLRARQIEAKREAELRLLEVRYAQLVQMGAWMVAIWAFLLSAMVTFSQVPGIESDNFALIQRSAAVGTFAVIVVAVLSLWTYRKLLHASQHWRSAVQQRIALEWRSERSQKPQPSNWSGAVRAGATAGAIAVLLHRSLPRATP